MANHNKHQKVVVIGGGTGLSTMLKGLKEYTSEITAIVTVADNGGGSGKLREEMGIIPPGDIRNCLVALANTEPMMEKLLQHRFKEGCLQGQSFGNLFLAALTEITGSFEEAVHVTSNVLAISGKVLPVTLEDVHLHAHFKDGKQIIGESEIEEYGKMSHQPITSIKLVPEEPMLNKAVITAIQEADKIILGPGSLYTSIIPNLLVKDICSYIACAKAQKIYIANIMTQPGETAELSLEEHLSVLEQYLGTQIIDEVIINNETVDSVYLKQYMEEGAQLLKANAKAPIWQRMKKIEAPLIKVNEEKKLIRHDPYKLAKCIFEGI